MVSLASNPAKGDQKNRSDVGILHPANGNTHSEMEQVKDEFAIRLRTHEAAAAIEELFRTHYQPLCNYARYFLKDKDESEEIVQGIFYRLWQKRQSVHFSTSVKSYLFTAVRNNCLKRINHMKVKNEYREMILSGSEHSSYETADRVMSRELEKQIKAAMDGLPEQCGLIFRLSRHGNLTYAEIAEHLDISVKTVENQMGKALRILREKLKSYLPAALLFLINLLNG